MAEGSKGRSSEAASDPPRDAALIGSRPVFISYASRDAGVAETVCQSLESHGASCWIAPRDVKPGAPRRFGLGSRFALDHRCDRARR